MEKEKHNSETLLAQTFSKDRMESLRKQLMTEFAKDRLWLFIYKGSDKKYSIFAANHIGGSLEKNIADKVVKFANDFMNDAEADTDRRPETSSTDLS